jgi:hypothetical protein
MCHKKMAHSSRLSRDRKRIQELKNKRISAFAPLRETFFCEAKYPSQINNENLSFIAATPCIGKPASI